MTLLTLWLILYFSVSLSRRRGTRNSIPNFPSHWLDVYSNSIQPLLLIMVPSSSEGVEVCRQCTDILARHRNVRVRVAFAGGAEESQILALLNGCDILISTPPCFLRMVKRCYTSLNRLCHVVFDHADIMVEEFTLDIREIMRLYAKVLKSQLCRLAPRQAVVMATSWTVGVASLVKAYLGNPVSVIANMIEAAIYKNVQQIATVCSESQRDVQLLGRCFRPHRIRVVCVVYSRLLFQVPYSLF